LHWQVNCGAQGLAGHALEVTALAFPLTVVVRVQLPDGRVADGVLTADSPRFVIPPAPSWRSVARGYLRLGLVHIATGPDHLLFVFGLVLLARTWRRVLVTVTAFTIGHSVTLALATFGLVVLPSAPIEFAIAVSVLALAIQVAGSPRASLRRPWLMAGAFGLLHGLGFAAVLREVGLPAGAIPLALFAFNVGIEIGQVAFVLVLLALGTLLRWPLRGLGSVALRAPAYVMGTLAAYWCFVRAAAWLHA
jgi:hydrogenase/urease accessory protein HupE